MSALIVIPVLLAGLAWLSAIVHWGMAVAHRKPEISLSSMLFAGMKSFDPNNFTAQGQTYQRRFLASFAVFFLALFLGVGLAVVVSQP